MSRGSMNLCLVAAEVAPWSKTGGLGDVCGALPRAMARRGHRVLVIAPRYKDYPDAWDTSIRRHVHLFGMMHEVRIFHGASEGVHHLFIDHPSFHRPGIYGDDRGVYGDNLFRFALLCRAALDACLSVPLDGAPLGEDVVFHCNDWHTGLLPLFLQSVYRPANRFVRAGTVLSVHNAGHHGAFDAGEFAGLDTPGRWWPAAEFGGRLNCLKTGLVLADRLTTVSPTYARELMGEQGFGLESIFRQRRGDLFGILNGIGPEWDPATDKHLPARYDVDHLDGKAVCKAALQREMGLPVRADAPLLAVVARLDAQKGISLLLEAMPQLLRQDLQLVVLGSGSATFADQLQRWSEAAPQRLRVRIGFDEGLAHRIEAGADIFLMPSRFEPCGLNQMYSMRYGTVPVVHSTGGLADTVQSFEPGVERGTGWAFSQFTPEAFLKAVGFAIITRRDHPESWRGLQERGMRQDWSWDRAAALMERVYRSTTQA
jgi:starch synthase